MRWYNRLERGDNNEEENNWNNSHDLFNLREYDFYDIWLDKLKVYRIKNKNKCKRADCPSHKQCRGCCSYYPEITTCYVG